MTTRYYQIQFTGLDDKTGRLAWSDPIEAGSARDTLLRYLTAERYRKPDANLSPGIRIVKVISTNEYVMVDWDGREAKMVWPKNWSDKI